MQHGKTSHAIDISGDHPKVSDLMAKLEEYTGLFPRQQKLIFKGRVLQPFQSVEETKVWLAYHPLVRSQSVATPTLLFSLRSLAKQFTRNKQLESQTSCS